jgi:integral membrane protein
MIDLESQKSTKLLKILSFIEGTSLLILLFVAMPLKYMAGDPRMVKVVGMTHGLLFILLVIFIVLVGSAQKWSKSLLWLALISATLPFGMFVLDYKLRALLKAES